MEDSGNSIKVNRPLLQRRNSLTNTFQSLLDAFLVLSLFVLLSREAIGALAYADIIFALILLGSMAVTYDYFGIYRQNRSKWRKTADLAKAWLLSLMSTLIVFYFLHALEYVSRDFIIIFAVAGFLLQLVSHFVLRSYYFARAAKSKVNAVIIGEEVFAANLREKINLNPWVRERVVSLFCLPESDGKALGSDYSELVAKAVKLIEKENVRSVYLALPLGDLAFIEGIYLELMELNVDVHWVPNIHELRLINPSVKELAGYPVMTLNETPLIGTHRLKKMLLDKVLAIVALLLLSWLMIGTAIVIKLTSAGPVFFRQARTGWDGKEFRIWKFRSMRVHEEKEGVVKQATKGDDRITPVGRFIRKTSIDELPQLLNVLAGNMSMVGPRPHAVQHNQLYSKQINAYLCRHRIKPGITGLAQVRGYRGETEELEMMSKRVDSDLEYINNWSVSLDLIIIFRTALTLFSSRAY
jgi:putative colanic acid biosynthesis UDP-glucose lipid carrier transferase